MLRLLSTLAKSSIAKNSARVNAIHTSTSLNFQFTPVLCAEPLKKKKKIDPAVVKAREDRRRKKLEKQIRRLEKNARQLKPIEELEAPLTLIDEKESRARKVAAPSEEVLESRALLNKKWAHYRYQENLKDFEILDKMMNAQTKALDELRLESEELYLKAIQPDMDLIPFVAKGPVRTPPIKGYEFIDGDYNDVTKKFDGESK